MPLFRVYLIVPADKKAGFLRAERPAASKSSGRGEDILGQAQSLPWQRQHKRRAAISGRMQFQFAPQVDGQAARQCQAQPHARRAVGRFVDRFGERLE
jgi:hypothetical protein